MKKAILLILLLPMLATAQYFDVFDIDTSEYPIMKAKFYSIDANGKQILNHTPADFEITENGEPRDVISVSCPQQVEEPFSVVIAVDISSSMSGSRIENSKNAIKSFIDMVPDNGSEVAIIAFNSKNFYVSDFSSNKDRLKIKVENLNAGGGTNFDAAFINQVASSLLAIKKAKNKNKSVIIVTDGSASGNENGIINEAILDNISIFNLIIGNNPPDILKNISKATGGRIYNNIITEIDFNETFGRLSKELLFKPCEISWNGKRTCENILDLGILNKSLGLISETNHTLNSSQRVILKLNNNFMDFGKKSADTTITITAINATQRINNIIFEPNFNYFKVLTPLPTTIKEDESVEIEIRYSPVDDSREYILMDLISDYCTTSIGLLKGDKDKPLTKKTLKLTHPNGGEVFIAGTDTIISWEGISKNDSVKIELSIDNGKNWISIENNFQLQERKWNVSNFLSDSCLISIKHDSKNSLLEFGDIRWEKSYGGTGYDRPESIVNTLDNGCIVAGVSYSENGNISNPKSSNSLSDIWIMKLNYNGGLEWERSFGGSFQDFAYSVSETNDGGFIVAGVSSSDDFDVKSPIGSSDIWILKLSFDGDIEWEGSYGGKGYDIANSISQTKDSGFIIVGGTNSNEKYSTKGLMDVIIIKINEKGELEWEKTYGGSNEDNSYSVKQTEDLGFIIAAETKSNDGDISSFNASSDIWILKLNTKGELEWEKTFGGSSYEKVNKVIQTKDGNYIILGSSKSNDGDIKYSNGKEDIWLLKLNTKGELEWEKTYGGSNNEEASSIIETKGGDFIVSCSSESIDGDIVNNKGNYDYIILQIDTNGNIKQQFNYGGSNYEKTHGVVETTDGDYILVGSTISNDGDITKLNGSEDYWIVKIAGPPQPLQSDTSDAVFSIIMPEPVIQNNDIDMGQMIVGSTKDTIVSSVICNTSDAPLHVLGVDITGGDASDFLIPRGAGDFYLAKDSCQDMMFEFTPSALGNRTAVATIRTTIGDFTDTINIRGVGIDPVIEATAELVDFGVFELGEGKDTTVVLVKNVGTSDITITDTRLSGPDTEQFSLNTAPISYTISAGEEKEFQLNYTAKYGGKSNSFLDFHYDGIGSPIRSLLFAEGIGGEVYPQVADAYVGETVNMEIYLGKIKPEGLNEIATNFSATVSYNSTLLAPIDKSIQVTSEDNKSYIKINGVLSGVPQIAAVPMKVGLGTAVKSGLVITEFQLYDANGDSVDYDIEPGVGEFNVLGICEEGGVRLINPNGEAVDMVVTTDGLNSNARINLTLIETGQTDIVIFDQIGNKIETVYSGTPSAGQQEINLDLSKYTNGRYYIKLTTPTITKTEIIEVVR